MLGRPRTISALILEALPGTTRQLAHRTRRSPADVGTALRYLVLIGEVKRIGTRRPYLWVRCLPEPR